MFDTMKARVGNKTICQLVNRLFHRLDNLLIHVLAFLAL